MFKFKPMHIRRFEKRAKKRAKKYNITQSHAECFEVNYLTHNLCMSCEKRDKCNEIWEEC